MFRSCDYAGDGHVKHAEITTKHSAQRSCVLLCQFQQGTGMGGEMTQIKPVVLSRTVVLPHIMNWIIHATFGTKF
jgi:hypothetical protein